MPSQSLPALPVQGPHPIAATIAVVIKSNSVLLVRRANPPDEGRWAFPGGKIDFGESVESAVLRELLEETGIQGEAPRIYTAVDVFDREAAGSLRRHYVLFAALCRYVSGEPVAGDDALDVRWMPLDALDSTELALSLNVASVAREGARLQAAITEKIEGGTTKTYQGSCHCGACRFEVDMNLDHVRSCNCSICRKRGALIHRVPAEAFRPLTPLSDLTVYEWHTRTAKDYFCPQCGILPFRIPSAPTVEELARGATPFTGWAINVRCLDDVDLESIPIKKIFGADLS